MATIHGAALLARRVRPLATLGLLLTTAIVYAVILRFPAYMLGPAILIAVYTAAARCERQRSVPALIVVELTLALLLTTGTAFPGYGSLVQFAVLIAAGWFLGDLVRRLAEAREELARRAVSEERLRIARELHDVVAHSMTVVALHAGSGRLSARQDPEAAQKALETIERSSREALADMRRLVGVLREGEEAGTEPMPGIDDIDRLAEEIHGAGVVVEVTRSGPLERIPAGLGLAVFRIAQEALTNVVRHSGSDRAWLTLALAGDELVLQVRNGPPTRSIVLRDAGGGHGISGMKERVSLYGGSYLGSELPDGGYQVEARFPMGDAIE